VGKAQMRERVAAALRMVGLEGLEARRPGQLSGGQQQRVALARTLVLQPRALLLDEPLSNLDARLRAQMRVELRRLHRELGVTTIYVTHDQDEAMALSTRIAVLDRGALVQLGPPLALYGRPRTRFVADFLGGTNVLPGTLEAGGEAVRLRAGPRLLVGRSEAPAGARVLCLVRQEPIRLTAGAADGPNHFAGRIMSAVFLGGRYDCEVALADGITLRVEVPAGVAGVAPTPDETTVIVLEPEDVIVLAD